jgi:hypothetical protein
MRVKHQIGRDDKKRMVSSSGSMVQKIGAEMLVSCKAFFLPSFFELKKQCCLIGVQKLKQNHMAFTENSILFYLAYPRFRGWRAENN